jgi:hypothetical protein
MCRTAVPSAMTFFTESRQRLLRRAPAVLTWSVPVIMIPETLLQEVIEMKQRNSYFQVVVIVIVAVVVAVVALVGVVKDLLNDSLLM